MEKKERKIVEVKISGHPLILKRLVSFVQRNKTVGEYIPVPPERAEIMETDYQVARKYEAVFWFDYAVVPKDIDKRIERLIRKLEDLYLLVKVLDSNNDTNIDIEVNSIW